MPQIVILAGPNGAGKSTAAAGLLSPEITFLNADEIAKSLPGVPSAARDISAGRLLLRRLDDLQSRRQDIAIETTLASRTLAPRVEHLQKEGYRFYLFFFWLPSPDLAVQRVAQRVLSGGHDIPEPVIRRRYEAGLSNFFGLYRLLANIWRMYDNTSIGEPSLIAKGAMRVQQAELWKQLERRWENDQSRSGSKTINLEDDDEVDHALGTAVMDALREHKRLGQSVVVWRDGKVVTVAPEDIPEDLTDTQLTDTQEAAQ